MERYIDAERLLLVLEKNFGYTGGAATLKQLIDAAPTADVAPVVHGEWKIVGLPRNKKTIRCSICGGTTHWIGTKYCPHCGAKMKEG